MALTLAVEFVKTTLENCIGSPVEVAFLLDYLGGIDHNPTQTGTFLENFMSKWKRYFEKSPHMMIVKCSGTWTPNYSGQQELEQQQEWESFVTKYDPSFSLEAMRNVEGHIKYQPLNFKELIQLSIWKDLYDIVGHQTVSYIFEKCAILYEIEEGFYLIVAYNGGLFYKQLYKFYSNARPYCKTGSVALSSTSTRSSRFGRNPYQLDAIRESSKLKISAEIRSEKGEGRVRAGNGNEEISSLVVAKFDANRARTGQHKRKNDDEMFELENSLNDRIQQHAGSSYRQEHPARFSKRQKTLLMSSDTKVECHSSCDELKQRWMKPKREEYTKLVEHRNSLLNSASIKSTPSVADEYITSLNYVHIQKDDIFKGKNKLIVIKEKSSVSANSQVLPQNWKGLKLPEPETLTRMCGAAGNMAINVYHISETLARNLGFRVKPKGRQRRKKHISTFQPEDGEANALSICSSIPVNLQTLEKENANSNITKIKMPETDRASPTVTSQISGIGAFVPHITLPITPCLYNPSSWSKWPTTHCLMKAATDYPKNKETSFRHVIDAILKVPICSEMAHKHMIRTIKTEWSSILDDSFEVNTAVHSIVQAHVKFPDIHRLVKSCVLHWRKKFEEKAKRMKQKDTDLPLSVEPDLNFRGKQNKILTPQTPELFTIDSLPSYSVTCQNNNDRSSHDQAQIETLRPVKLKKQDLIRKLSGNTKKPKSIRSLRYPVPYNCVMQVMKQVFHILKLNTLFGSKRNVRGFFKFVRKAIILGGTKSGLHLGELMALISPLETPFAEVCGNDELATEVLVAKVVTWLFKDYVLVLLKNSFYVTECANTRSHVKFFIRESWTGAVHKMRSRLLREGALKYHQSNQSEYKTNAIIRFIPKKDHTLRPLLIGKKVASRLPRDSKKLKYLLNYIDARINLSRVHLPRTIQNEWCKFIKQWRKMGSPKLYYLRLDIQDAYPSVSAEQLKEILLNVCGGRNLVQKNFALFSGNNGRTLIRGSIFDEHCRSNWYSGIHVRPCIAMDLNKDELVNTGTILENLPLIDSPSLVKIGKKVYEFQYGLPQGWGLSSVLCSIYYGNIDSTLYIPFQETCGRLFLRVVDDYIFVTPNAKEVSNLMQLIKMGCEKHKLRMNEAKSETNIFVRSDQVSSQNNCESTTFCGWNLCFTCGHVSRDYRKYKDQDFSSTVTFNMLKTITNPEQFIRLRGTLILPVRLKPILMDMAINCDKRVLLTVYEAAILLGFRFYALCRVVYPSLNAVLDPERAKILVSCIRMCCARVARFAVKNCNRPRSLCPSSPGEELCLDGECCGDSMRRININPTAKSNVCVIPDLINYDSFLYASLRGFRLKLFNHSAVFQGHVLPEINRYIAKIETKLGSETCTAILNIVGTKMPPYFLDIAI